MSLPLLHAGRTNPGLSAALDLRFALDKSLTAYRGPTPSFSRASTGSYFDASGVLRYAALNLNLYSEQFDNAAYTKNQGTISANQATAPDGKLTADSFTASAGTVNPHAYQAVTTVNGSVYTFSIYVKKNTHDFVQIVLNGVANGFANFDINNGVLGTLGAGGSATSSIVNVGNGWYRCVVSYTTASTSGNGFINLIGSATAGRGATFTAAGTESVYLWGQQLEASSTVGTYCPTTTSANSAPRFDHTFNGTSWVSRGLLVEEQRTNQLTNSNNFSSAFPTGGAQWSSGAAISPDGTSNAWKIFESAPASGSVDQRKYNTVSFSGAQSSFSIYAKAAERRRILLFVNGSDKGAWFDLISQTCAQDPAFPGASPTIQDAGNGWCRCTIVTPVAPSIGNLQIQLLLDGATSNPNRVGDGVSGVYLAFVQHEIGAFPTSYIGTTSSAATRSADVCQITGADFSGFWNGTEGTVAVEFDRIYNQTSGEKNAVWFAQNSASFSSITMGQELYNGSEYCLSQADVAFSATPPAAGITGKSATGYKVNDYAFSLNGASALTDTVCTVPTTVDRLVLGNQGGYSVYLNGHIARLRYYRKRLPNATLQLLSEPDPTLNLQFALNKSLTPVAGPTPSFSRASTGTFFNASGVLTSASINTPRFDHVYSGGQWVSRGLLIEEQRTNSLSNSEDFTVWAKSGNGQINSNVATAPDGTTTADEIQVNSGSASASYETYRLFTYSSVPYSISIFVKYVNNRWVSFGTNSPYHNKCVFFDILNGVVGTASPSHSGEIINCGNGWFRLIVKFVGNTGTNNTIDFTLADGDGVNSCTTGAKVLVWGAQIEAGSFSTSYIGTTSSSVTRSADVCQITGTSFNWMWNQGEGSVAVEFDRLTNNNTNALYSFFGASEATDLIYQESNSGSETCRIYFGNVLQCSLAAGSLPTVNTASKTAFGFKQNDFAASQNGAAVVTDTSGNLPICTQVKIGAVSSVTYNGHIAKLIYYPARLTNAKLQQLST